MGRLIFFPVGLKTSEEWYRELNPDILIRSATGWNCLASPASFWYHVPISKNEYAMRLNRSSFIQKAPNDEYPISLEIMSPFEKLSDDQSSERKTPSEWKNGTTFPFEFSDEELQEKFQTTWYYHSMTLHEFETFFTHILSIPKNVSLSNNYYQGAREGRAVFS